MLHRVDFQSHSLPNTFNWVIYSSSMTPTLVAHVGRKAIVRSHGPVCLKTQGRRGRLEGESGYVVRYVTRRGRQKTHSGPERLCQRALSGGEARDKVAAGLVVWQVCVRIRGRMHRLVSRLEKESSALSEYQRMAAFRTAGFPPSAKVSLGELGHVFGVDHPVVTLAVLRSARLHEAVVAGQVVPDAVPPARAFLLVKVRVVLGDVVVDRAQSHAFGRHAQNRLRDHGDECFRVAFLFDFVLGLHFVFIRLCVFLAALVITWPVVLYDILVPHFLWVLQTPALRHAARACFDPSMCFLVRLAFDRFARYVD